jgi:hypothetical protein
MSYLLRIGSLLPSRKRHDDGVLGKKVGQRELSRRDALLLSEFLQSFDELQVLVESVRLRREEEEHAPEVSIRDSIENRHI